MRHPFVKHFRGDVSFPGIGENHHYGFALAFLSARNLNRGPECGARAYATQYPFQSRQLPGRLHSVIIRDLHNLVNQIGIQDLRHESRADTLYLMQARAAP